MQNTLLTYLEQGQYRETEELLLRPFATALRNTAQNPDRHGEGDVLTHTDMVVDALLHMEEFWALDTRRRNVLFCAAVLHDVGKPRCPLRADGGWKFPHHADKGALLAREYLWRELDMAGEPGRMTFREAVCLLIRYHDDPLYFMGYEDAERKLRRIAANGELVPDFSMEMLYLLSKADILGRKCGDQTDSLCNLDLFAELCEHLDCFRKSYPFFDGHTAFSYLNGKNISPELPFYDDTWGEVILMSALPGTGKDTCIRERFSSMPMISLDDIRKELGCRPTDAQGPVIAAAKERAKELLRAHRPFVWNATCTTGDMRKKQIDLFMNYGASVRIVYLETGWTSCLSRNAGRADRVPEKVMQKLLCGLSVPERFEAAKVEWNCI